jgi:hypothetical protein
MGWLDLPREGSFRRRLGIRRDEGAVSAQVGSVMLVVITVVLASVTALFVTGLVRLPEPPPTLSFVCSHASNRWDIHMTSVSEQVSISEFRLLAVHANGSYIKYDTDADLTPDRRLVGGLDSLRVLSADWPHLSPLVFVDHDANGKVGPGDFLVAFGLYFSPVAPLLDATRGFEEVEPAPGGIPRGSQLLIVASPATLTLGTINPGDTVRVTLDKGGPFEITREGVASASGTFVALVDVEMGWVPATYTHTTITVRPGEVDEWTEVIPFKVRKEEPITPAMRERYEALNRPLGFGDVVSLIHTSSNAVVLRFRL